MVDIRYQNVTPTATLYKIVGSEITDSFKISSSARSEIFPKYGWNSFVTSVNSLQIINIDTIKNLDDYSICNDGYGVTVEIATKEKYRVVNYPCYQENKSLEGVKITSFMKLLKEQFPIIFVLAGSPFRAMSAGKGTCNVALRACLLKLQYACSNYTPHQPSLI